MLSGVVCDIKGRLNLNATNWLQWSTAFIRAETDLENQLPKAFPKGLNFLRKKVRFDMVINQPGP